MDELVFDGKTETVEAILPDRTEQVDLLVQSRRIAEFVEILRREADLRRNQGGTAGQLSFIQAAELSIRRYMGDQWTNLEGGVAGLIEGHRVVYTFQDDSGADGVNRATVNLIRPGVLTNLAHQAQQPVVLNFQPTERHDEPELWLRPKGVRKLLPYIEHLRVQVQANLELKNTNGGAVPDMTPDQQQASDDLESNPLLRLTAAQLTGDEDHPDWGPTEALDSEQGDAVQQMIDDGLMERDDVTLLNDETKVKYAQRVWDDRWRRARGEYHALVNEFLCKLAGWHPVRLQWHATGPKRNQFTLHNDHILSVWIDDRGHESIDDADYLIFDYTISLDRAKAEFPRFAPMLERAATIGVPETDYSRPGAADFARERPMVTVTVAWIRHQLVPATVEEALADELVEARTRQVPRLNEAGEPVLHEEQGQEGTGGGAGGGEAMMDSQEYLVLAGTETEIRPPEGEKLDPKWPMTRGLVQVITIPAINETVQAGRCKYMEMPWGWNINDPVPYSLHGTGDPLNVDDLQKQINRTLSIYFGYLGYYQFPMRYWKQSVLAALQAANIEFHAGPGQDIPIPDEEYDQLVAQGKMCIEHQIAVMPPELMSTLWELVRLLRDMMGATPLKQGLAPYSGASGEALKEMNANAQAPLNLRARFSEECWERIATVAMDCIVRWMDDQVWMEILDELTWPVIRRLRELLTQTHLDFYCEMASGRGANEQLRKQETMVLWAGGGGGRLIDREETMKRMDVRDPESMKRRIDKEDADRAAMMAPPAPAPAPIA